MRYSSVISEEEFSVARVSVSDTWSDYDVFEEERSGAPLREFVREVVEGEYTHPQGLETEYQVEQSAFELVWDRVFSDGLVSEGIPDEVRERFAREFGAEVVEYSVRVFREVRGKFGEDVESLSELRVFMDEVLDRIDCPEKF